MYIFKNPMVALLLFCFTLVACDHAPYPEKKASDVAASAFKKGVVYASWWHGEYSSTASDRNLAQTIKPMGANWIEIIVTCYQENISSTTIKCDPQTKTPTDADLMHVIQYAHNLGLRVMLKPHVDLLDDPKHWRGEIGFGNNEADWKAWFESYTRFIDHYATLARKAGADYFVIGTELSGTTHRSDEWRAVIKKIRNIYSGALTYAANHSGEEFSINWWDAVNAIGIDAYYPIVQGAHPTVEQIKAAWAPIVSRLGQLSKKWQRPVIFTEIGYESFQGESQLPCCSKGQRIEDDEQAVAYRAVFDAFAGQEWWHGIFWWVWTANSTQADAINDDFSPRNKPAEGFLKKIYGGYATLTPDIAPEQQLSIYHDALATGWEIWSWRSSAFLASRQTEQGKSAAIKVLMSPQGAFSLHSWGTDTSPYYWLEFYINIGKTADQRLSVSFNDKSDRELPQKIMLPNPIYLEGGRFIANQWQRVRIPLVELGASDITINRLNIKNNSEKYHSEFKIDEIRLIGATKLPGK